MSKDPWTDVPAPVEKFRAATKKVHTRFVRDFLRQTILVVMPRGGDMYPQMIQDRLHHANCDVELHDLLDELCAMYREGYFSVATDGMVDCEYPQRKLSRKQLGGASYYLTREALLARSYWVTLIGRPCARVLCEIYDAAFVGNDELTTLRQAGANVAGGPA